MAEATTPKVVIVGAGFGGLAAAKALADAPVELTIVDRRNVHLFQPLLYQVATAALSPADISQPIRKILRGQKNAKIILDKVAGIDTAAKTVRTERGPDLPYDILILATGARHSYFGREDWAPIAPGIKTIDDATKVRAKILLALERAEAEADPAKRKALLTFIVVGGGPTGVELAGAIAELARPALSEDFRSLDASDLRVILAESGPRILAQFREDLAASAHAALVRMGVEVRPGSPVKDIAPDHVAINGEVIGASTVIWAAGVRASPAGRWIGAELDRVGRVKVNADFSVPGHPEIFVIGDTALYLKADGKPLPGVAPVAKQSGEWVGNLIAARSAGKSPPPPFRYRDWGSMATVGRNFAIGDFGRFQLTGFPGWIAWSLVHVWYLIGFRNRFSVALAWFWSYLTFERGARLITGEEIARALPPQVDPQET